MYLAYHDPLDYLGSVKKKQLRGKFRLASRSGLTAYLVLTFNSRILLNNIARYFPSSFSCASNERFYIEFSLSLFLVIFWILLDLVAVIILFDRLISSSQYMVKKGFLDY